MSEKKKILITSALPYANGPLHFGHIAGAYLPGDCCARYQRLKGQDVLYICGSDEYGVAITLSAEVAGRTPREHVDCYHEVNKNFFSRLNLSFDHYSRTTSPYHEAPVQQFFKELLENGYIEERMSEELYSEEDNRFLADRYVVGSCPSCGYENARGDECPKCAASYEAKDLKNPRSKLTGAPLVRKETKHWFLLLEKFKERLLEWLEGKEWKPNVTNFVREYIKGLRARAITRDSNWGIPVPLEGSEGKVLYVWFDAPIGYISASMEWAAKKSSPDRWKEYWCDPEVKLIQFIGKDNIPFHAAIFPAMVMGQNSPYKLVDDLPANEFYNLEGRQFSKSDGWMIDLESFFKSYSADQIRYTIAANAPETQDSEFTWKDFQLRCNAELLGKYGNLVNRVLVFAHKKCDGKVPKMAALDAVDQAFLEKIQEIAAEISECYHHYKLRRASHLVMELAQAGNVYFDTKHPWKEITEEELATTIACCLECLKLLALTSFPIIPETAEKVWRMIGNNEPLERVSWDEVALTPLSSGSSLKKTEILFRKIEDEEVEQEVSKLKEMAKKAEEKKMAEFPPLKEWIEIDQVQQLDLRVGKVVHAEVVPKSKKLLKLEVDIGFEKRSVLSGVRGSYKPEELIGKQVVIVANLKPATILGIESQGMLLAACNSDHFEMVAPLSGALPPGSVVR